MHWETCTMSTLEIVPSGTYDFSEANDLVELWRTEGGENFQPTFARIKVPGAGGTTWEIDDEHAPTRELRGVVVAWTSSTALFLDKFEDQGSEGGNRRPDAYSNDGVVQIIPPETYAKIAALNAERQAKGQPLLPNPEADLQQCPYSRWGSVELPTPLGETGGKDTNEYRNVYIVIEGSESPAPYHLQLPATSIKHWDGKEGYAKALLNKGISLSSRVTEFTLHQQKSGNVVWSEVHARSVGRFNPSPTQPGYPSDKQVAKAYSEVIGSYVKRDPFRAIAATPAPAALPAPVAGVVNQVAPVQEQVSEQGVVAPAEPEAVDPGVDPGVRALDEAFAAATPSTGDGLEAEPTTEPVAATVGASDDIDF